ncbi:MAG TPA: WD40 repeat domain-containing protein, partial [Tepidisphaeraceae bacterium]|nr:WD40 repeat domain-containing protein [Tepidisphaeraceae bacterium]
ATAAPAFSGGIPAQGPLLQPPPIPSKRQWQSLGPMENLVHDKLPLVLIIVGYVLPLTLHFIQLLRADTAGLMIFGYVLGILGFIGITIPMTVGGLKIAAKAMSFELVPSPGYRMIAALSASTIALFIYGEFTSPAATVGAPLPMVILGYLVWLLGGLGIGLLASFALVWLFFRLSFVQALITWFIAGFFYFLGVLGAVGMAIVVVALVARAFPSSAGPVADSTEGGSTGATGDLPAATDTGSTAPSKRDLTVNNLRTIYSYLQKYYGERGAYPHSLDALVAEGMPRDALKSPYGPGFPDYSYFEFPKPNEPAGHDWILSNDRCEGPIEGSTEMLRGNGSIDYVGMKQEMEAIEAGQHYFDEARQRQMARNQTPIRPPTPPIVFNPPRPTPPPAPTQWATTPAAPSPNAPPPQPSASDDSKPIEPPRPAGPAWTADVDAPIESPTINTHLREVFNGADDLYFSQNGGAWLVVNPEPSAPRASFRNPTTAELWNLRTLRRVGQYPAIPDMHDVALSPAGNYLVGRTLGGDPGVAVAYEVWSARNGKLLQTLATDPITGGAIPRPIGFPDSEQVRTAGDEFNVWSLKTGARIRQFGDQLKMDSKTLIAPSPNCQFAAVLAGDDSGVWLVSVTTGKTLGQTKIDDNLPIGGDGRAIAFSPDGKEIAALVGGQGIYVWSAATGTQLARFDIEKPVSGPADGNPLVWMPDGQGWLAGG